MRQQGRTDGENAFRREALAHGDALYNLAEQEAVVPVVLDIGQPGQRVSIVAPEAQLRLNDEAIIFAGEANRTAIRLTVTPFLDGLVPNTPDSIVASLNRTGIYLGTS